MNQAPMKLLYVSHLHPPAHQPLDSIGGMQSVSVHLYRQLQSSGRMSVVPCIQEVPWKGIEKATVRFLASGMMRLPRLIRDHDIRVVLFSSMVSASLAPYLKWRGLNVPLVTINHGQDVTLPSSLYQRYVPRIFDALDHVISVSHATREQSLLRGLDPAKASVLPNGIDERFHRDLSAGLDAKKVLFDYLGANPGFGMGRHRPAVDGADRPVLITVGRLVRRKGHAWFIANVLPLLQTPVDYVIIGEGPEQDALASAVESLPERVPHRIHHLGRQPENVLKMAYSAADLFVMPNIPVPGDMEGFGVVLLEANLAGTPAIASDLEGIRDVVSDGVNGCRIPALDASAFAVAIGALVADTGRRDLDALKSSAQAHVKDRFLWPQVADGYMDLLESIARGSNPIRRN